MRHFIEPNSFSLEEQLALLDLADRMEADPAPYAHLCDGRILATLFYEPSTRTRLSFEVGIAQLGGQPVIVKGNRATLEDGTIAGSNTNLMKCMRTAVKQMGIPLEKAVKCAAVNPAKSIGVYDKYGSITPGKVANAVLLDQETLEIKGVILKGQML